MEMCERGCWDGGVIGVMGDGRLFEIGVFWGVLGKVLAASDVMEMTFLSVSSVCRDIRLELCVRWGGGGGGELDFDLLVDEMFELFGVLLRMEV